MKSQYETKSMINLSSDFWLNLKAPFSILLKEYAQMNKTFAQNVSRAIGLNYILLERASQEKKKIP